MGIQDQKIKEKCSKLNEEDEENAKDSYEQGYSDAVAYFKAMAPYVISNKMPVDNQ